MSTTIRQRASSLLFTALTALTAGACFVEDAPSTDRPPEGQRPANDLWLDATEVAGPNGPLTQINVPGDDPATLDGGICGCATDACRAAFVQELLGCGVCVAFNCGGQRVGACAPCDDRPDHAVLDGSGVAPPPAAASDRSHAVRAIDLSALGTHCSNSMTCSAGLTCVSGGIAPQAPSWSCEIPCPAGNKQCPTGTTCVVISDGPGRVCHAPS